MASFRFFHAPSGPSPPKWLRFAVLGCACLTACMRKLVVILNAMLREGTDWRQTAPAAS
jgi:hypothetical protein